MSKMSENRKIQKGVVEAPKAPRPFDRQELLDLQQLHKIVSTERFKAEQIKLNTALIPEGQKVAEQQETIARLFENFKNTWVGGKLRECGYPQGEEVSIDLETGAISKK